jgi:hypothetical protein
LDYTFELPPERLVIKEDQITVAVSRELRSKMDAAHQEFLKSLEDQSLKVQDIIAKYKDDLVKEKDESDEDFSARSKKRLEDKEREIKEAIPDDSFVSMLAFHCLKGLGELFNQGHKVTEANFEKANYSKVKTLLAKLLISNECNLGSVFLPPTELNQKS